LGGKNAIIATGTSSGKTLCYQIPILDDLVRNPSPGLRALIIYPLNALVNDQLTEWEDILKGHASITFARFTGQTPSDQKDYTDRLQQVVEQELRDEVLTQQERQREVARRLNQALAEDPPNRLNHRGAIRSHPPHILITNFSMLEYLLERPVDAPIFENARLKFLVLDEAHAYRGAQATEIAFLVRRLKDRLGIESLACVGTSATLGKPGNTESEHKVQMFAHDLFGEEFAEPNPIYGTPAEPELREPSFRPTRRHYSAAADRLRADSEADLRRELGIDTPTDSLAALLLHDTNLFRLRKDVLTQPKLLQEAAEELWPNDAEAADGLQALLEVVAVAKKEEGHADLLPTRLHYFVKAQDGLHVCLHKQCQGRIGGQPASFVSRKSEGVPEGLCPDCFRVERISQIVEVVTCRKCGYLFCALQDLGPRRARSALARAGSMKPQFDTFSTELGWAADSFWSYFSVEEELPFPAQAASEEEEDQSDLFLNPVELEWCVICGRKRDQQSGENCACTSPHLRQIKIFHRQCPADDYQNLYRQEKRPLTSCPNCGARNASGLEPLRRFQESEDETGLAMAIPFAQFQVSSWPRENRRRRKLLCFTDHRQPAAAFPALLEEETFAHDMGREIVRAVRQEGRLDMVSLGEVLADIADPQSEKHNPDFFLPASRFPDEELRQKEKRDLWVAETFGYFGIPDSARESAEDLGLVAVKYDLQVADRERLSKILGTKRLSGEEAFNALQTLFGFMRHRKAFTLPKGRVRPDATAFGRVTADLAFALRREGNKYNYGWLPSQNRSSVVTDYLMRLLGLEAEEASRLAENIWTFLINNYVLSEQRGGWKLDHEKLYVVRPERRFVCTRCGVVTAYSARACCPRKECQGTLEPHTYDPAQANIIERWVSGDEELRFTTLKSEEHTAQIKKDLAKQIEDEFRAEGINLLSSTTTFELGINIGDLQKVLLRNAPPASANYVQRAGRAGRGDEKNAVCVTLCRRSQYDSDAWKDPPRLMSGEVRPPTVFISNKVIAQRHFNAAAFAQFLRVKVSNEHALGGVAQQVPLEPFLALEHRAEIPSGWVKVQPANVLLDFVAWLEQQTEREIFQTDAGHELLEAIGEFEVATRGAVESYRSIREEIGEELTALVKERKELFDQGGATGDVDTSIKKLLGSDVIAVLAKRGFLPRYAFPLDVVTLETGLTRWSADSGVELSRDRGLAIVEFAPDAQVIARKKVFTSAGLYVMTSKDRPERRWYAKCPGCEQIRTAPVQDQLKAPCAVCQHSITVQHIKPFVEPEAFGVRIDKIGRGASRHRRNTLIRQRQTVTHFIDSVEEASFTDHGQFRLALKRDGKLGSIAELVGKSPSVVNG
jgi:DEAD/DEAH box helicase/Helicase conserved C-terminal domain